MSDDDDFLKAMTGVRPLQIDERVTLHKGILYKSVLDKATIAARRESAETENIDFIEHLSESEVSQVEPNEILAFRRSGVQHGVYKRLRLGRFALDAHLDLHGLTVNQARQVVYQFTRDCLADDVHCGLVTHGKGEGRKTPAVLKSHLAHWLIQIDEVLAFHSAQNHHGGAGACYILFKKRSV